MKRTFKDLCDQLKQKENIIVIGPGIDQNYNKIDSKNFNKTYTIKNMRRNPKIAIDFYKNNLINKSIDSSIYDLIYSIPHTLIVDQNTNAPFDILKHEDYLALHGHQFVFECMKCKKKIKDIVMSDSITSDSKCECGSPIRPSILMSGEKYKGADYEKLMTSFVTAKTLFLIGVDFNEEFICDIIDEFNKKRALDFKDYMIICVKQKKDLLNLDQFGFFDFIVEDDNILESLKRFQKNVQAINNIE